MSNVMRCDGCYQDITGCRWRLVIGADIESSASRYVFGPPPAVDEPQPEYRDFHGLECLANWVQMGLAESRSRS